MTCGPWCLSFLRDAQRPSSGSLAKSCCLGHSCPHSALFLGNEEQRGLISLVPVDHVHLSLLPSLLPWSPHLSVVPWSWGWEVAQFYNSNVNLPECRLDIWILSDSPSCPGAAYSPFPNRHTEWCARRQIRPRGSGASAGVVAQPLPWATTNTHLHHWQAAPGPRLQYPGTSSPTGQEHSLF
jgi:hypothetical protein